MARRRWNIDTIKKVVEGENPFIQLGYSPLPNKKKKRKEGETWEDSKGKRWKRKNGIDVKDTPLLDELKKMYICKKCGCDTRFSDNEHKRLDMKVIFKTGMCFDCLQEEEMVYRINGQWENYEKMKMLKNRRGALRDFRDKVLESIEFLNKETGKIKETMPDGTELTFSGTSNPQWIIDANADLIKVNEEIKKIDEKITNFEMELKK